MVDSRAAFPGIAPQQRPGKGMADNRGKGAGPDPVCLPGSQGVILLEDRKHRDLVKDSHLGGISWPVFLPGAMPALVGTILFSPGEGKTYFQIVAGNIFFWPWPLWPYYSASFTILNIRFPPFGVTAWVLLLSARLPDLPRPVHGEPVPGHPPLRVILKMA